MITEIKRQITKMEERDPVTERIIACAYKVHSELGPGFSEIIYHKALILALKGANLRTETEKEYKVTFQGRSVGSLRVDLMVEDKIVVEVKAVAVDIPRIFEAQVLSYLKVTGCKVGLLINFGNRSCQVRRLML